MRWAWVRAVGLVAAGAVTAAGCDTLTASLERNEATVELTPLGTAETVSMVHSTSFSVGGDRILLLASDTQSVSIPATLRFPLDDRERFYVSVRPDAEGDTASVRMEVWIDGVSWFVDRRTLGLDSIGAMTFVYRVTRPTL